MYPTVLSLLYIPEKGGFKPLQTVEARCASCRLSLGGPGQQEGRLDLRATSREEVPSASAQHLPPPEDSLSPPSQETRTVRWPLERHLLGFRHLSTTTAPSSF